MKINRRTALARIATVAASLPVLGAYAETSLFVDCDSESELRRISAALLEGGTALMPLNRLREGKWMIVTHHSSALP